MAPLHLEPTLETSLTGSECSRLATLISVRLLAAHLSQLGKPSKSDRAASRHIARFLDLSKTLPQAVRLTGPTVEGQ